MDFTKLVSRFSVTYTPALDESIMHAEDMAGILNAAILEKFSTDDDTEFGCDVAYSKRVQDPNQTAGIDIDCSCESADAATALEDAANALDVWECLTGTVKVMLIQAETMRQNATQVLDDAEAWFYDFRASAGQYIDVPYDIDEANVYAAADDDGMANPWDAVHAMHYQDPERD